MADQLAQPYYGSISEDGASATWQFRLFIAGSAPNSRLAMSNLAAVCESYLADRYSIEIVDVLKEPARTLEDNIIVTPTLLRLIPAPTVRIIGNLSDHRQVIGALGLVERSNG
jgi:circadian clock protein KaiB